MFKKLFEKLFGKKKPVILVKVDVTGLNPEAALKFANDVRESFLDGLGQKEREASVWLFLPSFEGDVADIKEVSTVIV